MTREETVELIESILRRKSETSVEVDETIIEEVASELSQLGYKVERQGVILEVRTGKKELLLG